jgi:hypothetical protein
MTAGLRLASTGTKDMLGAAVAIGSSAIRSQCSSYWRRPVSAARLLTEQPLMRAGAAQPTSSGGYARLRPGASGYVSW